MPKTWRARTVRAQHESPMRLLGLALFFLLALSGQAQARREQTYAYAFNRVWNTAVRLLRIDFTSAITEKDKDSGYFLFDFTDGSKQFPGSIEVIRLQESGPESVRVVVQIPALPSYVEQNLLDRLARKLSAEYGTPIGTKPPPKPEGTGKSEPGEGAPNAAGKPPAANEPASKPAGVQDGNGKPGH